MQNNNQPNFEQYFILFLKEKGLTLEQFRKQYKGNADVE